MDKVIVRDCVDSDGITPLGWMIFCPACGNGHLFDNKRWTFDGDHERPTFSPSMLVRGHLGTGPDGDRYGTCHSFVRGGKIEYLGDCTHDLAGQVVDLEPF